MAVSNVYNELGPGNKESVYQKALALEFDKRNVSYESQKQYKLKYDGKIVGIYVPDFVVEDKVIIEIKSVVTMPVVCEKQLFYYPKLSGCRLGYLINFGAEKLVIKRRVN